MKIRRAWEPAGRPVHTAFAAYFAGIAEAAADRFAKPGWRRVFCPERVECKLGAPILGMEEIRAVE